MFSRYRRAETDLQKIIKYAKLAKVDFTQLSQAVYYPDTSDNDIRLLQLEVEIFQEIMKGELLYFKGEYNENAVLCTGNKTYELKETEVSNSLILMEDLQLFDRTYLLSLSNPKSNANTETLKQPLLRKIFNQYIECREVMPRFGKLKEFLKETKYYGPNNECYSNEKCKLTFEQLLATIQCSQKELVNCLNLNRAVEIDGFLRVIDKDYEFFMVNKMLALIAKNSWDINNVDKDVTIAELQEFAHSNVAEKLFYFYIKPTKNGKYQCDEEKIAKIIAYNILQPGLKFGIEDFLATWQQALPEGIRINNLFLNGIGIIDSDSPSPHIKSLAEENLSTNLECRLQELFDCKYKWTLEEIKPYIQFFVTANNNVSDILSKHTRSVTVNGHHFFVTKHK